MLDLIFKIFEENLENKKFNVQITDGDYLRDPWGPNTEILDWCYIYLMAETNKISFNPYCGNCMGYNLGFNFKYDFKSNNELKLRYKTLAERDYYLLKKQ